MTKINNEYLHSVVFGIEDSLVSTTGLIVGLSVGANDKKIVILGGAVAIAIEAVSMGAGEYLSDDAVAEADKRTGSSQSSIASGLLMFCSYLLAGLIPLVPVLLLDYPTYLYYSVILALCGLFTLGYLKGRVLGTNRLKGGFKILIVGGLATLIGVVVGLVFKV